MAQPTSIAPARLLATTPLPLLFPLLLPLLFAGKNVSAADAELEPQVSRASGMPQNVSTPLREITREQLQSINFINTEDAVRDQPGIIVRKRYIGDPNATLGMRGSNMFQTTRSLVFADGMPLHYHLQTRYSGAPRWSVVAPAEIQQVDILYGPFAAEYSGNAMGGVVNIQTRLPDEREISIEGSSFVQDYDRIGRKQQLSGQRLYTSWGERFGNLQLLAGFQRLQNDGQPQSFYYSAEKPTTGSAASGGMQGRDSKGNPVLYYGDAGIADTLTDLYKIRARYNLPDGEVRASLVYEQRQNNNTDARSLIRDAGGNTVYSGNISQDGHNYSLSGSSFHHSRQDRHSLLSALGVTLPIAGSWYWQADISQFDILKDEQIRSARNPADPAWDGSGDIQNFRDTGWQTADIKSGTQRLFGRRDMNLLLGYHYGDYQLELEKGAYDYASGQSAGQTPLSGGETRIQAIFADYGWQFTNTLDLTLGLRHERWQGLNGFKGNDENPDRNESAVSPKFSLGWQLAPLWHSRYSLARAVRFPIVEELYENASNDDVQQIANASLKPETGIHHNLNIQFDDGRQSLQINLFYEKIRDTIFNQSGIYADASGNPLTISSFLNIDRVSTRGADISLQRRALFMPQLDVRFNATALRSRIDKNDGVADSEGKDMPRIPRWSQNLTLTWHQSTALDFSTSVRHISDSYNELDNSDHEQRVFGAIDAYTFIDARMRYQFNRHAQLSVGADNITDRVAYVHHPYPSRTLYLEGGYRF